MLKQTRQLARGVPRVQVREREPREEWKPVGSLTVDLM